MSSPITQSPSRPLRLTRIRHEDLAFALQQLGLMLQSGLPLEASLLRLADTSAPRPLQSHFQSIAHDLSRGISFQDSLRAHHFPSTFIQTISAGITSHDLPPALTLLSDHYHRLAEIQTRLRSTLGYPLLLLLGSCILSFFLAAAHSKTHSATLLLVTPENSLLPIPTWHLLASQSFAWIPPISLLLLTLTLFILYHNERFRAESSWRIPGLRDAALSRLASLLHLLLSRGTPLPTAIQLLRLSERSPRMQRELDQWLHHLQHGEDIFQFPDDPNSFLPPILKWLAMGSRGGWSDGFRRAAIHYHAAALHQLDLSLRASMPLGIFILGLVILFQVINLALLFCKSLHLLTWT